MGNRLSRIVTRTGDGGSTGMADGSRRDKTDVRVHSLGEIDELNACIGVALSFLQDGPLARVLFAVQHDLFDIGAEICQPGKHLIDESYVAGLEESTKQYNEKLPVLKEFILSGGSPAVAHLQLARTVCRRAERRIHELGQAENSNPVTGQYLNRLSDLLFVLARAQGQIEGGGEVYWNSKCSRLKQD